MTKRPEHWPRSPHGCPHPRGEKYDGDEIGDGKGNVIAQHIRCTECGIIIRTERPDHPR